MGTEDCETLYKVVLVGDSGVGKTHLLSRYLHGTLPKRPQSTLGVEFATRTLRLPSGHSIKAQLWDTAGQERFRAITRVHYRGAGGGLLVYDLTNRQSFNGVLKWLRDLREHACAGVVIMLVGNKLDLDPAARKVDRAEASALAERFGLLFAEVSAVTMEGVQDTFERILQEVHKKKLEQKTQGVNIATQPPAQQCCAK